MNGFYIFLNCNLNFKVNFNVNFKILIYVNFLRILLSKILMIHMLHTVLYCFNYCFYYSSLEVGTITLDFSYYITDIQKERDTFNDLENKKQTNEINKRCISICKRNRKEYASNKHN